MLAEIKHSIICKLPGQPHRLMSCLHLSLVILHAVAIEHLIKEIQEWFPAHIVMDAIGLVYPQYWINGDPQALFCAHLDVIKKNIVNPSGSKKGLISSYAFLLFLTLASWRLSNTYFK